MNGFTSLYCDGRLEWLGVRPENSLSALRQLLEHLVIAQKAPLQPGPSDFRPFNDADSAMNLALLQQMELQIKQELAAP